MTGRLADRDPRPDPQRLLAELVPPPRFDAVRFDSYRPDPAQPSQAAAVQRLEAFATDLNAPAVRRAGLLRRVTAAQPVGR